MDIIQHHITGINVWWCPEQGNIDYNGNTSSIWFVPKTDILTDPTPYENNYYNVKMIYDVFDITSYQQFEEPITYET
jgi:hypothetical protein